MSISINANTPQSDAKTRADIDFSAISFHSMQKQKNRIKISFIANNVMH